MSLKISKPWHELTREEAEELVRDAEQVLRMEYYQCIRGLADDVIEEAREQYKEGARGERLREWLIERLDEMIDGHHRVIYTWQAQKVCLFSENDGAYIEEFGEEGIVEDGVINWSRLAFGAMRADLQDELQNGREFDVNDPEAFFEAEADTEADE